MPALRVRVEGRVQGVFFREYTRRQATDFGLSGWVRNLPDGAVEALLIGEEKAVATMLAWFRTGSPLSRVDRIETWPEGQAAPCAGFTVRR
jgi:acylphosphatase